jgi:hypothetical protein
MTSTIPVTATGGTGSKTYTITPALPAGLAINATTGAITGTPTTTQSATGYTIRVTDSIGVFAEAAFTIAITPPVLTVTQAVASTTLVKNVAATPLQQAAEQHL